MKKNDAFPLYLFIFTFILSGSGCGGNSSSSGSGGGSNGGAITFVAADCQNNLAGFLAPAGVTDWAYWLDGPDLVQLSASDFDLIVMDYSSDGSEGGEFTALEIANLKASGTGKTVLAYMSIGEAEADRFYWDPTWVDGSNNPVDGIAPDWLFASNPDFPDNYKVQYWDTDWQDIIYGDATAYLDRIIAAGFDGVYLDIIDAFEYFGPDGESSVDRATAGEDMIAFVLALTTYARTLDANFMIFPQNGTAIFEEESACDYLAAINGLGSEDNWYYGDAENNNDLDLDHADEVTPYLDEVIDSGKMVLAIDYVSDADKVDDFYTRAQAADYLPYVSVRDLNALTAQP
ncbi:MAG TPA: hypothetical protein DDW49_10445 [Deltaproteobacteria bacterium]|nr:MAG: hypothetical protein A2048_05910 [Deltaproteobacteria bacterium GWA2_45_12]HBF13781.1 hypothetical protein [Deltaproteobacteria bacterium]